MNAIQDQDTQRSGSKDANQTGVRFMDRDIFEKWFEIGRQKSWRASRFLNETDNPMPNAWGTAGKAAAWEAWQAARADALEEAAVACERLIDNDEHERAAQAAKEAEGTADELRHLRNTVSIGLNNSALQKAARAIRQLKEKR
jgi:hypothetical protein